MDCSSHVQRCAGAVLWVRVVPCSWDLEVPHSPVMGMGIEASQGQGPPPMMQERMQSVISQLFQNVSTRFLWSRNSGFVTALGLRVCFSSGTQGLSQLWDAGFITALGLRVRHSSRISCGATLPWLCFLLPLPSRGSASEPPCLGCLGLTHFL